MMLGPRTAVPDTCAPAAPIGTARAPKVTVFIPVYNREKYVAHAIDSILAQSFRDFELLLLDDGSTDGSLEVLRSYSDPRVRVERNEVNLGIPRTRNRGLDLARGEYLALLDSDDFAYPERLRKQVEFLDRHPDVAAVGAFAACTDDDGRPLGKIRRRPVAPGDVAAGLLFRCGLQNSASMARTDVLRRYRYREEFDLSEDYDLWVRVAADHKIANLPEVLVNYRAHGGRTTRGRSERVRSKRLAIFAYQLSRLGVAFSEEDLARHHLLARMGKLRFSPDRAYLRWAEAWLLELKAANRRVGCYPEPAFSRALGWMWMVACLNAARRHVASAGRFWLSPLCGAAWSNVGRALEGVGRRLG